jgi:pyrimidine 5'-nucleotidase
MIRILLFDLDDTLYPRSAGVMDQIRQLILRYIRERLHLSPEEADELRRSYFMTYGTTMRGLQIERHIDADEFLHYVHDIPLEAYLQPNPKLDAVLASNTPNGSWLCWAFAAALTRSSTYATWTMRASRSPRPTDTSANCSGWNHGNA